MTVPRHARMVPLLHRPARSGTAAGPQSFVTIGFLVVFGLESPGDLPDPALEAGMGGPG